LLHVVQISFFADPGGRRPEELLQAWPTLVDVAEAAQRAGVRVCVVQASSHRQELMRQGVTYHFLPFGAGAATVDADGSVRELLEDLDPDVLHVQGLGFAPQVLALAAHLPGIPILLQDHADRPPRWWRRRLWRRAFSLASGLAFCSRDQARPFIKADLLNARTQVYEIPECPSRFTPGDQTEARRLTGLSGDPGLLWVGHLDANKDPLAVLDGVSEAVQWLPALQLWCCFGTAPLLPAVQRRIESDPRLRGRVHLLGRVAHQRIEQLMRAADIFVLGSHREGSGYSLIEALACGLAPVVTDIPSFRTLTAGGSFGALWPCGDARGLTAALISVAAMPRLPTRAAIRTHFDQELSFDAVGRKLASTYEALMAAKAGQDPATMAFPASHRRVPGLPRRRPGDPRRSSH
jgi:glycosyltransferase involved in cell wall biosynthesis